MPAPLCAALWVLTAAGPPTGWDVAHTLRHDSRVAAVAFAPDALATADARGSLVLWDPKTGKEKRTLLDGAAKGAQPVDRVRVTADGKRLLAVTGDGAVAYQWALDETTPPDSQAVTGNAAKLWRIHDATPDGRAWVHLLKWKDVFVMRNTLRSGAGGGVVETQFRHADEIDHLAPGPDNAVFTIAGGVLRRWSRGPEKPDWQVTLLKIDPVAVAVSPDGAAVAVPGESGEVRLFSARTGNVFGKLTGHKGPVYAVAFSPDGRRIVTGGEDRTARLWDAETLKELAVLKGHADAVTCAAFGPSGDVIATGSVDKTVRVWRVVK
jgi:WD40 repeat protein